MRSRACGVLLLAARVSAQPPPEQTEPDASADNGPFGAPARLRRRQLRGDGKPRYNDHLKVSVWRYHAPVAYCSTACHRGSWLQTTIFRPDMFKEEWFQPDHFVGAFVEGTLLSRAGLGYIAGYGNGRDTDLRLRVRGRPDVHEP